MHHAIPRLGNNDITDAHLENSIKPAAPSLKTSGCNISEAQLSLPAGQTTLVAPTTGPSFIAVAVGTQNYTCSNTSTYTNIGAVAELFDASCLYGTPIFSSIQNDLFSIWEKLPASITPSEIISFLQDFKLSLVLGQHYYVTNPITGVGVSPKWDFTSASYAGDPNAYVIAARVASIHAPDTATDVDWVELNAVQGDLASQVFRVDTKGGQPPASCTFGSAPITVKYTAKYWLYGGTVKT